MQQIFHLIFYCFCFILLIDLTKHSTKTAKETEWKLTWEENFTKGAEILNGSRWQVTDDTEKCSDVWSQSESNCNARTNVRVQNGFLVLEARYQRAQAGEDNDEDANYYFTGATITTRDMFKRGRFEFRAAQPSGRQLRTCIFALNDRGQENVAICSHKSILERGLLFTVQNSTNNNEWMIRTDPYSRLTNNIHDFHLYGFEWSSELRFFFDDFYTDAITFNKTHFLQPWHRIQLQISVIGGNLLQQYPSMSGSSGHFRDLHWKCPSFIVDYFRYYEEKASSLLPKISERRQSDLNNEKAAIAQICAASAKSSLLNALKSSNNDNSLGNTIFSSNTLLQSGLTSAGIAIALVLFGTATIYILVQLRVVKSSLQEVSHLTYQSSTVGEGKYRHSNVYHLGRFPNDSTTNVTNYRESINEYAVPIDEYDGYETTYPITTAFPVALSTRKSQKDKSPPPTVNKFHTEQTEERLSICNSNIDLYVPTT